MADEIVVKYVGDLDKLQSELRKTEQQQLAIDKASKKTSQNITKDSEKAAVGVQKVQKNVVGLKDSFQTLSNNLPFANAIQQVTQLSGAMTGLVKGTQGATTGMKVLRAAVISTGVGALVVAIIALIGYFKRTDEGATKLEGIMGGLGAALDEVTGFIAEMGSIIFEAFESVENFGQALRDLGEFVITNLINRFKSVLVYGEAIGLLFKGEFAAATKKAADGLIQMNTGIENGTDKFNAFAERIAKAAQEAYDFAVAMDAISDAQRDLNVELSANRVLVVELIKQSKNHSFSLEERQKKLREANALDEEGLRKTLDLENQKLALIQKRNKREKDSINQILAEKIKEAKSEEQIIKLKEKALSVNDDLAQEEADQIIKINGLRAESIALQERNNSAIAALQEQAIAEELENEKIKNIQLENIEKQRFLNSEISAEELVAKQEEIFIQSLIDQRAILLKHKKDVTEIDKAILDAQIKQRAEGSKVIQTDALKALDEAFKEENNLYKENYIIQLEDLRNKYRAGLISREQFEEQSSSLALDIQKDSIEREIELIDQKLKVEKLTVEQKTDLEKQLVDKKKELGDIEFKDFVDKEEKKTKKEKEESDKRKANLKATLSATIDLTSELLNGLNDLQLARQTQDIENERAANDLKTQNDLDNVDKRLKAGFLSEEAANAKKAQIQKKAAKQESELKKKQFEAEQKAAINRINISTAEAVAKNLATYGFTPLAAIAIAATIASGEIQKAFVRAQPVPKFKDGEIDIKGKGTTTSDSIPAMISKGESVIKASQTKKYKGALEAINGDYFDKWVNNNYLENIKNKESKRKARELSMSENIMKSLAMNNLIDTSHLERLTKKNKSVRLENVKEIIDGLQKVVTPKSSKGL